CDDAHHPSFSRQWLGSGAYHHFRGRNACHATAIHSRGSIPAGGTGASARADAGPNYGQCARALATRSKYDLSSVEWATIGGAASSPTLIRDVERTLGFKCYSGYGLTECAPSLANAELKPDMQCSDEERYVLQAMTGYAFPGCELRVVDA